MRFLMLTGAPGAGKTLTANKILSKYNCRVISMNANIVKTLEEVQRVIGS
jgi:broad-specificity NMP kinase